MDMKSIQTRLGSSASASEACLEGEPPVTTVLGQKFEPNSNFPLISHLKGFFNPMPSIILPLSIFFIN
jgi:hypothetical protein